MIIFYLIIVLSIWLFGSSLVRFVKRIKVAESGERSAIPKWKNHLALYPFFGGFFLFLAIFKGARIFFSGMLLMSIHILAVSLLLGVILDFLSEIFFPVKILGKNIKIKMASHSIIGICGISLFIVVLVLRSMPGYRNDALKMSIPFQGKWRVITGGRFKFMNYHHGNPDSQNMAVDFVITQGGEDASRGQKVFSPVSGAVIKAVGNLKEGIWDPPEGNIVIIQTDGGIHVWLCHLQEGSVMVSTGERIRAGQEIAACGASGGADVPHLHLHAEREKQPVPILLGRRVFFPIRGDIISAVE